jgi:hypothetical protein
LLCYFCIVAIVSVSIIGELQAQSLPVRLSPHDIANGNVHIVAVMAEFQEDDNRFTTGNGKFNPSFLNRNDITLDPLPHDRGYFEAHLQFAKNYFETVSNGKLTITFEVLPEIITLPKVMAEYSPVGPDDSENYKLAEFARDAWNEVANRNIQPHSLTTPNRTMYIIFHAGAGRDLELTGTTLTKTPQDIPSVFLSPESIKRLLNDPDFTGFPLSQNINVWNTAILPETQSRPGEDILGNEFVLELSINGIITATIGSFIGLPDLFNTETGQSGIGRFGLMDGAGFFSYFGLFPPEPSAWEKTFLGWIEPFDISQNLETEQNITLPSASLREDSGIAKYPISANEYFLIENRHRDPSGEGIVITTRTADGSIINTPINIFEERFNPFDFSKISEILPPGVVINVSNFDWSLPGGLDTGADRVAGTSDDRLLNGGILIWHIDESVIFNKLDDNTINNNPNRRGVNLVEADAAQDIGKPSAGASGYDQGNPFDFWWSGNDFTVITASGQRIVLYQNRFAYDTRPNNRSNSGARSYFEFLDFSDNIPRATFKVKRVTDLESKPLFVNAVSLNKNITQSDLYKSTIPLSLSVRVVNQDTLLIIPEMEGVHILNTQSFSSTFLDLGTQQQPLLVGDDMILASNYFGDEIVRAYRLNDTNNPPNLLWESQNLASTGLPSTTDQQIIDIDRTTVNIRNTDGRLDNYPFTYQSAQANNTIIGSIRNNQIFNQSNPIYTLSHSDLNDTRLYLAASIAGNKNYLFLWSSNAIITIDAETGDILSTINLGSFSWPTLSDFNGDGYTDILFINFELNQIEARNLQGAMLEGFPIPSVDEHIFQGSPLILESTNSYNAQIVTMVDDGYTVSVAIFDVTDAGRLSQLLLLGANQPNAYPINPIIFDGKLYAVSPSGDIRGWELLFRDDKPTSYLFGNINNNKIGYVSNPNDTKISNGLLISKETYNWPNPAKDQTHIRFSTTESAEISMTIISYSGQLLEEFKSSTTGTLPNEIRINTSKWPNGVYFCRVTAKSGGRTEHKVITLVVAR